MVDAINAAMRHRRVTGYALRKHGLYHNLSTQLKDRDHNFTQKTISKIRLALNVGFAEDADGWYFSPLD